MAAQPIRPSPRDPDEDFALRAGDGVPHQAAPAAFREPPLPDAPTEHEPGTAQKMAVIRSRMRLKRALHHPEDARRSTLRNASAEEDGAPANGVIVPIRDFVRCQELYAAVRRRMDDVDAEPEPPADPEAWEIQAQQNRRRWARVKRTAKLNRPE